MNKNTAVFIDENKNAAEPLADFDYGVWRLPSRQKSTLKHGCMCGARLGPSADGSHGETLKAQPHALRIASPWEALSILEALDQIGSPPTPWVSA